MYIRVVWQQAITCFVMALATKEVTKHAAKLKHCLLLVQFCGGVQC